MVLIIRVASILSHASPNNILTKHMLGFFFLRVAKLNTKSQRHYNFLQINSMFCVDYSQTPQISYLLFKS